jgi:plastocyanin
MRVQKSVLLVILGVLVLALGGCGSDSNNDNSAVNDANDTANQAKEAATQSTAGSGGIALAADPGGELKYDKTALSGSAGDDTIDFTNDSSTPHNVTVEDSSGKKIGATDDITQSKATLKLSGLKTGDYTFFCSVPGHEAAGMKGTLTVK